MPRGLPVPRFGCKLEHRARSSVSRRLRGSGCKVTVLVAHCWRQSVGLAPRPSAAFGRTFPSPPATVRVPVVAVLSHCFLFAIADWWQQLQKQEEILKSVNFHWDQQIQLGPCQEIHCSEQLFKGMQSTAHPLFPCCRK